MKRMFALGLSVILCVSVFSACSGEKTIEDHVDLAMAQLGKPTAEAFQNMGLPGNPEDAVEPFCLYAKESYDLFEKRVSVGIIYEGDVEQGEKLMETLTEKRTDCVEYASLLNGDYAYVLKLYEALRQAYGEAEFVPAEIFDNRPFSEATVESLKASSSREGYTGLWKKDGNEVELFAYGSDESNPGLDGYVSLTIRVPIESLNLPPLYADDGTRIR